MSESAGEDFLKERGLIVRATAQRRKLLGCMSCQWSKKIADGDKPELYTGPIIECADLVPATAYQLLCKLEDVGVVESHWENKEETRPDAIGPPRRLYRPANSSLGIDFAASLGVHVEYDSLDVAQPEQEQDDDPATIRRAVASRFITTATIEELRWLKEQAEEQITLLEETER